MKVKADFGYVHVGVCEHSLGCQSEFFSNDLAGSLAGGIPYDAAEPVDADVELVCVLLNAHLGGVLFGDKAFELTDQLVFPNGLFPVEVLCETRCKFTMKIWKMI